MTPPAFPPPDNGTRTSKEGGVDQWSVRAQAVMEPNDTFQLTLSADYQNVDQSASPNTALAINPVGLAGLYNACLMGFAGPNIAGCAVRSARRTADRRRAVCRCCLALGA